METDGDREHAQSQRLNVMGMENKRSLWPLSLLGRDLKKHSEKGALAPG